jgi:hypothetical protein
MNLMAEVEYLDEGIAVAKAAGLGDYEATLGDATLDDAPRNSRSYFPGEQDAGGVEGFQNEGSGLATG